MDIERKCLQCALSAEDSSPKQQPQLIGHRVHMCLANPPTSSAVPTGNGGIALVASYPQVTKDSISCARWVDVNGPRAMTPAEQQAAYKRVRAVKLDNGTVARKVDDGNT